MYADAYGVNAYPLSDGVGWLYALNAAGFLGPSGTVKTDLPFDKYGEAEFAEALVKEIALRQGIGNDLADGFVSAAVKWGRSGDLDTGLLPFPVWGYPEHYDPRLETEWGFGTLVDNRDINEHDINAPAFWGTSVRIGNKLAPLLPLDVLTKRIGDIVGDPLAIDYNDDNIYTEHMANLVSWHRHYTQGWKQSSILCDWAFISFFNLRSSDYIGFSPKAEEWAFKAVTGKTLSFADGLKIGQRIWNLQRAINVLEGRNRDIEVFENYIYDVPHGKNPSIAGNLMPAVVDGAWQYKDFSYRTLSRDGVETWKDNFYTLEGWDVKTGWPTRSTLESLDLKYVADELQAKGKLPG